MAKLHDAARKCHIALLNDFLASGENVDEIDSDGRTALMVAAHIGCVDGMTVLLENGANVNIKDITDRTALHLAVLSACHAAIPLLAAYKADIDAKDCFGWTALILATRQGELKSLAALLGNFCKSPRSDPAVA
jgi:ankyrin repeat protein